MTSIIKFQALSGAKDESPPCYILQIDDFRFLLDCGWNEHFDPDFIKELKRYTNQIDAVLLTYPDNLHLGALPYLVGKCGLSCPIYCTIPVYKMGQMFMYDLYQSRYNIEEFTLFNLDDVDAAFDKVIQLKYNQTVQMKGGKCYGLSITPMPAGHMIGGTMWKINKTGEEDIIYGIDFNHKKERHLNGCDIDKLQRPSLLITDAFNSTYQHARRRLRDERLMTNILQTLRNKGNILIAVDTAGRVLELAHMLDQLWRNKSSGLQNHPLCLLNNVSYNVVEFAKSQIEWMSDKLMKSFEAVRNNPFQFKNIRLCHSVNDILKLQASKVVVLASMPDLECGFGRDLFIEWASQPENSIILTSRYVFCILFSEEKESSSEDELQLLSVSKGTHDLVIKPEKKRKSRKSARKTYPMYPVNDQKIKFDDYGELIILENYKSLEGTTISIEKPVKKKKEVIPESTEVPTKCVVTKERIELKANVQFIDFEGRSDGESMEKLIIQLKPRRVILVRGTPDKTEALAKHVTHWTEAKVYTPNKGDVVDATSEVHIYQIRLTDGLVSSLKMQKGKGTELAWINARTTYRAKAPDTIQTEMEVDEDEPTGDTIQDDLLSLEPLPLTEVNPHDSVLVNELRLSDLKQLLSKKGIDSEFTAGVLWCCNRTICIKRTDTRKVSLEGWISENYFKVREILYSQYAIL
ncbi:probable cleavage and polyadenylation specificity factor subunit 2 [Cimex lectularius]|uniref:Cleavage and polyadenylation specificity factor subunit 2 n=1 Tax=Cimex lectularius TaxID=79782 RepID=A0A8I6TM18_CIMLE|nr:probable cleavage and polyadenylation specificity factor subunit 2 [Cimex lectularius]